MKAYLIFNRNTPGERALERLAKDLKDTEVEIEQMDADSRLGIGFVESYDVIGRPAVALVRADGSPVQIWQGEENLPSARELSYLAHQ
jgi:hypothetical protein